MTLLHSIPNRSPMASLTAAALALGCLAGFSVTTPAMADSKEQPRTISITAEGVVESAPDIVEITAGVISESKSAREALDDNTKKMTAVVAAMKKAGIAEKDLQTTDFTVQPVYDNKRDPANYGSERVLRGYEVTNRVHVTLHEVDALGSILDTLVSEGANAIDDISFGLDDPSGQKDEARKQAMKAAIAKAKLYTKAAGARLGRVISISENDYTPMPKRGAMRMEAMASAPVPIEGGTTATSIQLNVTWELK